MNENDAHTGGFYPWIESLRTVRSPNRWIGGVVAGAADRLGMDRTLGRALFVVLTLLTAGLTVLLYGAAWMFLPEPDGRIHAREAARGRWSSGTTGALIVSVLGVGNLFSVPGQIGRGESFWNFGSVVGLAIIGFFVWLVVSKGRQGPPEALEAPGHAETAGAAGATAVPGAPEARPEPVYLAPSDTGWYSTPSETAPTIPLPEGPEPMSAAASHPPYQPPYQPSSQSSYRPPHQPAPPVNRTPPSLPGSTQLAVVGLAVLAGAAVSLLRYLDVFTASWPVIWAASLATTLAVLSIGLIIGAIAGRGGGGLTVTTAILALPVIGATGGAAFSDGMTGPWGPWSERGDWNGGVLSGNPADGYELSFGEATVNLSGLEGSGAATVDPVEMNLSFSTVDLIVPDDVDVYLEVDNSFSSVGGPNLGTDDAGRIQVVDAPGDERVIVNADLSFSTLNVSAEPSTSADTSTDTSADTSTTQE
ncbi:PspC domain-containing protein [Citricoccus nitrophenolicus]|uniref:PspC domain-containing protein n=1 Tax=Citricoccus nitrophenolicus TaxID=863575 RepID=A0ABV0IHW5_9MICC